MASQYRSCVPSICSEPRVSGGGREEREGDDEGGDEGGEREITRERERERERERTDSPRLAWKPRVNAYSGPNQPISGTAHAQCAKDLHFH